jgi:tetratricopeptide (TPR) repeat protein
MNVLRCGCGTALKIKPEMLGKPVRCPNCKQVTHVPADASADTVGSTSDTNLSPAESSSVNMPRLRSEAMRATTPVTSVQAVAASEGPVVKTVAAVVPKVAAASIPAPPPSAASAPLPPEPKPRKPREAPPLPPQAVPDLDPPLEMLPPLEDLPPLEAIDSSAWSGAPLEPASFGMPPAGNPLAARVPPTMRPTAAAKPVPEKRAGWPVSWWIGGGVTAVGLVIVAYLIGRGGREPEPEPAPPAAQAPEENSTPASEPPQVASSAAPQSQRPPKQPKSRPAERPEDARATTAEPEPPQTKTPPVRPQQAAAPDDPGEIVKSSPPPPRVTPPPRGPGGLTGVSRQYDDLDCMRIQAQHSVRVPAAATILEVNGQRLAITNLSVLAECPAPYLYLPRGTHAVRFRPRESPIQVSIAGDLSQVYHEMRQFFDAGGSIREVELLSRGAKAMDVHSAPFLLNLMGGVHLGKDQSEPAERKFRRSLRVNPLFAPAHLNLASLLAKRGAAEEARQELELADATNVGNCFGLSPAIGQVRRQLNLPSAQPGTTEIALSNYVTQQSLSAEDRRLTALMQALSKYAVQDAERGKILNNLAVHFAETGRTEMALDHFRSALGVLKSAGPERYKLAQQVLTTMGQACRDAKYEEADEYDRMRTLVTP